MPRAVSLALKFFGIAAFVAVSVLNSRLPFAVRIGIVVVWSAWSVAGFWFNLDPARVERVKAKGQAKRAERYARRQPH
jgi:hypothetical protein